MVRTYDPSKINVTVGTIPIGGFADGSMVKLSMASDAFTKVSGTDGITSRAKTNDNSGELTITLAQTSPSNDHLSAIAVLDKNSNAGVVPVTVSDVGGNTLIISAAGWIRKVPDVEFAKEISNREWILDLADVVNILGGTNLNFPE